MAFITSIPLLSTRPPSTFTPISSPSPAHPILHRNHARRATLRTYRAPVAMCARSERTFIAVKPDGMNRGVLGNVISRFENKGFKLVAIKTLVPTKQLAETHYAALSEKPFFDGLVEFITSGPVCAMVWEGAGVVKAARRMIGETKPADSAPGTIRGDLGIDVGRNVIHGSDAVETAEREISIWFEPSELASWQPTQAVWVYE